MRSYTENEIINFEHQDTQKLCQGVSMQFLCFLTGLMVKRRAEQEGALGIHAQIKRQERENKQQSEDLKKQATKQAALFFIL